MKQIVSFGDSFILGSEQANNQDGSKAWPGRIAAHLGLDYQTMAVAGCGNEHIAQQIFDYFANHDKNDVVAVVNWTWALRWDINIAQSQSWVGLGPTCVPDKLTSLVTHDQAQQLVDFYKFYCADNYVWNLQRSLFAIYAAQSFLEKHAITNIQTYIDRSIWCLTMDRLEHYDAVRDQSWPEAQTIEELDSLPTDIREEVRAWYELMLPPSYIQYLQKITWPQMQSMDGLDFLSWSRQHGYQITELLHPLEDAHQAAADYWLPTYRSMCQ